MTEAHLSRVRTGAVVAALVLAVLSRGDALVLAALLAATAWRAPALAVVPALLASSWRWGSTSLDAWAGAQAVLGPAGWVGPAAAAASAWLAAIAIVVSAAPRRVTGVGGPDRGPGAPNLLMVAVAAGATAAVVVAGPAPGGDLWIRAVATVIAAAAVLALTRLRQRATAVSRALDVVAVAASLGALCAVVPDAPAWTGTVDVAALAQGVVLAVAAALIAIVAGLARAAMGQQQA